jgi:uncharacterized protein (TIGR04141 family)
MSKTRKLTIYLLKDGIDNYEDAIVEDGKVQEAELSPQSTIEGGLFYKQAKAHAPSWLEFIDEATDEDLDGEIRSQHGSAILFVIASGRTFALVFGYARSLLHPASYVRDFGLKVVLNSVDSDKLRSIDTNSIEEIPVETRQQASRVSALELFHIDRDTAMMKALVGVPRNGLLGGKLDLGRSVAGAAALAISPKTCLERLGPLCSDLLKLYNQKEYQNHGFDWVDNLRPVSDPGIINDLIEELVSSLKSHEGTKLHLAPPEILEWGNVEGFRYSTDKNTKRKYFPDISIADFYGVSEDLDSLTAEKLKSIRVTLKYSDSDANKVRFPFYHCLVYDVVKSSQRYILANGLWFEVDKDFAKEIEDYVRKIPESVLVLAPADDGEHEGDYTDRVCGGSTDLLLMDKKTIRPTNARTAIEVCDIFTADGQFVHIKPYKGSSTLSHLFSQGTISADLFQKDPGFRKKARTKIKSLKSSVAKMIPLSGDIDTGDYEIVYAIIKKATSVSPWQTSLPFFAQLNLRQAATLLRNRGYKVSVKHIVRNEP